MGVIQRFKDIMSANVNAVLDKAEDPEKMIDQYMRNLQDDLGKVKAETAAVMAEETRAKRELDECNQEVEKLQKYAEKAVAAGNDSDARLFLQKKQTVAAQQIALRQAYDSASANAAKMRQMHDKIVKDMENLNQRKAAIKAKVAAAKAQERVNQIGGSSKGVSNHMSAFDRMEEKANKMLDQANAMAELNEAGQEDSIEDLVSKYDDGSSSNVKDEVAALKAKMSGKTEASEQTSGVEDELEALKAKLNTQ